MQMDTSATLSAELDGASTVKAVRRMDTLSSRAPPTAASASGQVAVDVGIFVDGGLDGKLANLFSKSVDIPIFKTTKNILTVNSYLFPLT